MGGVTLALALTLLAGASGVSAAGPSGHSGEYGRHYLADGSEYPGVLCRYDPDLQNFSGVKVDAPFVFAANTTSGLDRQQVAWGFRIQSQASDAGATWHTLYTSPLQTARASDRRDAAFTRMSAHIDPTTVDTSKVYRVQVLAYWYRDGQQSGRARHTVQWYHGGSFEPSFGPGGYCPGFIF
jgi:hypothetical protein